MSSERRKKRLKMKDIYLQKETCVKRAQNLISNLEWKNVSQMQLAKEIYGHAYLYYQCEWIKKLPMANDLIYSHVADGIDVEDKVDRFQFVWEWIWKYK